MKALFRFLAWTTVIVFAGLIALVLIFSLIGNIARPYINKSISAATDREFVIHGDMKTALVFGSTQSGWRRYVPRPRLVANDVTIGNAGWSKLGLYLATVKRVDITIDPLPLLTGVIALTDVDLDQPNISLERALDRRNNWTFKHGGGRGMRVTLANLHIVDGRVRYVDPAIELDVLTLVTSIPRSGTPAYGLTFSLQGKYHEAAVSGGGKAGDLLSLSEGEIKYPLMIDGKIGKNAIRVVGEITQPLAVSAVDVRLKLSGKSMGDLFPLTGVVLPNTPPYVTEGRLRGTLEKENTQWAYQEFTGTVGESDLAGTLEYLVRQPRPLLRGEVKSKLLRLSDLGATIGAESNQQKIAKGKPPVQPKDKALPVENFTPARWGAMDADVKFTGVQIIRTYGIPLTNITADLHMKDKVLRLTPLNFGMAGGNITSNIMLDGRDATIQAQLRMAARTLQIRQLFPKLKSMRASFGEVNGDAALSSHGNSISAMLGASNGELKAVVSDGSVSKFILEAAGLNIANAVFVKVFGDKQVHLNCLANQFVVKDGIAQIQSFVLDTDDAVIDISGNIDLARESLNLDVHPKSKGARIFSFRTPLYAKGSFINPDVGFYKGPLAVKSLAAVALAALSPAAAVLPLVNLNRVPDTNCKAVLAQASGPPHLKPIGTITRK